MTERDAIGNSIRQCRPDDTGDILTIINAAAQVYRGVIPADRWHDPYFPFEELASELADGVIFCGYFEGDDLVGVMGVQRRYNANLIRHAYVLPRCQGLGIGSRLLRYICSDRPGPMLIGTWAAADWAIRFYERHGFSLVADEDTAPLLRTFWKVPERQIATSIVLAAPALTHEATSRLIAVAVSGQPSPANHQL